MRGLFLAAVTAAGIGLLGLADASAMPANGVAGSGSRSRSDDPVGPLVAALPLAVSPLASLAALVIVTRPPPG